MKLQKIMIDGGFTCPNRDGSLGFGGCTFCRTDSFSPAYCKGDIKTQIEAGKRFFQGKYPDMKYLAYFQSYSNTYGDEEEIVRKYHEALDVEDVTGLVIGTRPDCVPDSILARLQEIKSQGYSVQIELGLESLYDRTLQRVNRGHSVAQSIDAVKRCADAGFEVCVHLIFGLPGETRDDILDSAEMLNTLPVTSIKIHQLQILKGTKMAEEWETHPNDFLLFSVEEYASLIVDFIQRLRKDIHIERFASSAPPALVIAPNWGIKPSEVQKIIDQLYLKSLGARS